jgi:O-antigen biosynthesis protein
MGIKNYGLELKDRLVRGKRGAFASSPWERYSLDASYCAGKYDFNENDLSESRNTLNLNKGRLNIKSLIWFIPEFNNPYWGGIHTVFRFAAYLKDNNNINNKFVVVGNMTDNKCKDLMSKAFPTLQSEVVLNLHSEEGIEEIGYADASICTLWTTAYYALKHNNVKRKFYFIQDFEPLFYPAGTISAQAEETYRFGFYGIANTISLKHIYENEYGGEAEFFNPAVDIGIFSPPINIKTNNPFIVFFYGRPGEPRNGFELGIEALKKLKNRMGDKVRIVCAGAEWDPTEVGLDGVIENLGLLTYKETAELYSKCDAALSMMFTRHPSYIPLELMASGCLVVTNKNPFTSWFLRDGYNCLLSNASVSCLADTLEYGLMNIEDRQRITDKASDIIRNEYSDWEKEIRKIYSFMSNPNLSEEKLENKST